MGWVAGPHLGFVAGHTGTSVIETLGWMETQVLEVAATWEIVLLVELVCRNHQKTQQWSNLVPALR